MERKRRKASLSRNTHVRVIEFMCHVTIAVYLSITFRLPRHSRHDIHRLWLSDDLPEALRLQRYGIKFACGCALHPMGHYNARRLGIGGRNHKVSLEFLSSAKC